MARREKKPIYKVQMTERKRQIVQQLLQEYDIETAEDIQGLSKIYSEAPTRNWNFLVIKGVFC